MPEAPLSGNHIGITMPEIFAATLSPPVVRPRPSPLEAPFSDGKRSTSRSRKWLLAEDGEFAAKAVSPALPGLPNERTCLSKKLAPLATKQDVRDGTEELARIIADSIATPFAKRFDRLEELLEIKDDVFTLKQQMKEIRSALHLSR
jgi:hypothetical protein